MWAKYWSTGCRLVVVEVNGLEQHCCRMSGLEMGTLLDIGFHGMWLGIAG